MNRPINNPPVVANASTQTIFQGSKQIDPYAGPSGTLGLISCAESSVTLTGRLPDREIQIIKDRMVVKIPPRLMMGQEEEEERNQTFSVIFPASSAIPELVNEAESDEGIPCKANVHLSGDSNSIYIYGNNNGSAQGSRDKVIQHQVSEDSGFLSQLEPVSIDSEQLAQSGFNVDVPVSLGLVVDSEVSSDSASTGKTPSLGRRPLSFMDMDSAASSSLSKAGFQCRFVNGSKIGEIIKDMGSSQIECNNKTSNIVYCHLVQYDVFNPPEWLSIKYNKTQLWENTCRFMLKKCALSAGYTFIGEQSDDPLRFFSASYGFDLRPQLVSTLLNKFTAFELIAGFNHFQPLLVNHAINTQFRGEKKEKSLLPFYEVLSFKNVSRKFNHSQDKFLKQTKKNVQYQEDCYPASYFFIKLFTKQLCKGSLPVKKIKMSNNGIFKERVDGLYEIDTSYSPKLLSACVDFKMAIQLVEKQVVLAKLDKFQSIIHRDGEPVKSATDYSEITDTDRRCMNNLLRIMDALDEEANQMVAQFADEINQLPRANKEGKQFEERVLGLVKEDNGRYCIEIFNPIRAILNRILRNMAPDVLNDPTQAGIVGDASSSSQ